MPDLPETRHSLLIRLRQRSQDGWGEFLRIYERAIHRFCLRRGLQDADARDVTQEVLTAVGHKVEIWDGNPERGSFRGWLFRVARNLAARRVQDRSRRIAGSGETHVAELLGQVPGGEKDADAFWLEYRRSLLDWAADQVRPVVTSSSWQAFWRTAVLGEPAAAVARSLSMSVGGVYTAKCRVIARLRAAVDDLDDDRDAAVSDAAIRSLRPCEPMPGEPGAGAQR